MTRFGILLTLTIALLAFLLGGCATSDSRITALDNPSALTELGLDVSNPYGSVRVEITDRVDHICVAEELLTPAFATEELRESLGERIQLHVDRSESMPGFETLRLTVLALEPLNTEEGVNLTIRLPRCSGIRVRNAAGDAILLGATGAIHVETIDGDIEVRCSEPLQWPVALIADTGNVYLQTPGGVEGRVELVSNSGEAVFTSTLEPLHGMAATRHFVRGSFDNGANPITCRSDTGNVRMMVIENPMGYTRWKTGNRRIASPEKYSGDEG